MLLERKPSSWKTAMTKKADILKATYKKMLASVGANSDHVGVGGQDGWCRRSTL